jgi:hypothetical protein
LRDEEFGFTLKHSRSLQLARLVERVIGNFGVKRLRVVVFLEVNKAYDSFRVNCLLFKLTAFNFSLHNVKIIFSSLHNWTFEASFQTAAAIRRDMRAGVAQGGLVSPVLFSPYLNYMPMPSRSVELALYADNPAIIATSRKSALVISCLETYLSVLELWLREWKISIKVSKSNAVLLGEAAWRAPRPRPVKFLGQPIQWDDTARYL